MKRCPYCKGEMERDPWLPPMSARKRAIYNAVANAGPDGIESKELIPVLYTVGRTYGKSPGRGAPTVLRVQIHEMNALLKPLGQRISARNGAYVGYILTAVSTGEDDGKTAEKSSH